MTQDELKALLHYDPVTGVFTWLENVSSRGLAGTRAGCTRGPDGYRVLRVCKHLYREHRLAWFYMTGRWPTEQIDHKDGDRQNNSWGNLREATNTTNGQNKRKAASHNKTGLLGVGTTRRGAHIYYRARIALPDKGEKHLGYFKTPELAHAAYLEAKRLHHPGCTI